VIFLAVVLVVHLFSDLRKVKMQQSAAIAFVHDENPEANPRLLVFATQGSGHGDEIRILDLLRNHLAEVFPFDRRSKIKTGLRLFSFIRHRRPDLVVMEGTGFLGGAAIIMARLIAGVPYVVSSGDAVAPFLSARIPLLSPLFWLYEKLLCRLSSGFIGWTPYLVGRALTLGAPRGMTAPGWAPFTKTEAELVTGRQRIRSQLGIPEDAIVFGIVGTLVWNPRVQYCYGVELIKAAVRANRNDIRVLVVGDGAGRAELEQLAGNHIGSMVKFAGRADRYDVPDYLAAMDLVSLPQSVDGVGSFRYTTKLSEYLAAGIPVITGQIPLSYDLDGQWLWRLPGYAPWSEIYIRALANLMKSITQDDIRLKAAFVPRNSAVFGRDDQVNRVTAFLTDILAEKSGDNEAEQNLAFESPEDPITVAP
jgi:glycosyltransferase involved in cell wall biosynthesis